MSYPKDPDANIIYRAKLLLKAQTSDQVRIALYKLCKEDRLFWFNTFAWTYDPRSEKKHLPFITYPFQDHLVMWDAQKAINQEDSLIDKSRDMGATVCLLANDVYDWLFADTKIEIVWGSRNEKYVDERGNMKSIFEKMRYMIKRLPEWMLPEGFNYNKHATHMKLINPKTESSLTGEATNENFARGDRKYRIRFDEFAFWDMASAAWRSSADTSNCRTALSTPCGSSNKFAQLSEGTSGEKIDKLTMHWTLHPRKNKNCYYYDKKTNEKIPVKSENANKLWLNGYLVRSDWYDAECLRRTKQDVAQEIDIDYLASGSPKFNIVELNKQIKWKEYEGQEILGTTLPMFTYVRGNLVDEANAVTFRQRADGWCLLFEHPKSHMEYVIGTDTCEGLPKGDKSWSICIDKYFGNVCGIITGCFAPEDTAYKAWLLEKYFNNALNLPENNNTGYTTCLELSRLGSNLGYSKSYEGTERETTKRGFTTTNRTRPMMIDRSANIIDKHECELRYEDLIKEHKTFVTNKNGKSEADGDFNDDGVLAYAIAQQARHDNPYVPQQQDTQAKLRSMSEQKRKKIRKGY